MTSPLSSLLSQTPIFSGLDPAQLDRLTAAVISRRYPAGAFLTCAGDHWPYLLLLQTGCLHVLKESVEGRSLVIASIKPGDVFWGSGFFGEDFLNPASLQSDQPSSLLLWNQEDIQPLLLESGHLVWELSRLMMKRMLHASEVIEGLAFQPVAGRLARLLVDLPSLNQLGPVARSLTLDDMASRIGTSREVVCRFLQRFADQGIIKITRTEFEITDRERLVKESQREKQ